MRRFISFCCAASVALQPLVSNAQAIAQSLHDADKPLPHVLPLADRVDQLPLPYMPPQWMARTEADAQEVRKVAVANAISMSKVVNKTTASVGDTLTWTLTADNLTTIASGALTATDTLPANISTIAVTPGSGVTCGTASAGAAFTCSIPSMAANTSNRAVATISATATAEGSLTNTATLTNASSATLNCNGVVGNCAVTTQVQDDDDSLLPAIVGALKPVCTSITAAPGTVTFGDTITLNAACTFKGNLVKHYTFYRTDGSANPPVYLGDSTPIGSSQFKTTAPSIAGTYTYWIVALNGGIPSKGIPGAAVSVVANPPPKVSFVGAAGTTFIAQSPATLRVVATDNTSTFTVAVTSGMSPTSTNCTAASLNAAGQYEKTCDFSWTPSAPGVYTMQVSVTDGQGAVSTGTTSVVVGATPGMSALSIPGTVGVGTTAGQFAVSESGAATYSIPIQVPPGVAGLQPNLAITYNSQGGDGPLGVGWNLSGLSSITRCPKTIATDGVREPINYDNITNPVTGNDAFCLDGQRLLPVTGGVTSAACQRPLFDANGNPTGATVADTCTAWEFRTELESYSRIIGIGDNAWASNSPNTRDGSGPTRFQIYSKSGQILEYGSRWWGVSQGRPENATNLLPNPGFEDTDLSGSPWRQVLPDPQGYFRLNGDAVTYSTSGVWTFDAAIYDGLGKPVDGNAAGVQANGSAFSGRQVGSNWQEHPTAPEGTQTALIQGRGQASVTLPLEGGKYKLQFQLAGRGTNGQSGFSGIQTIEVRLDGVAVPGGAFSTATGDPFSQRTVIFDVPGAGSQSHTLTFAGTTLADGTALLDDIKFVPLSRDIYSVKIYPLDRVEDRNGNYMHVDYGGTHLEETVVDSYGTAQVVLNASASRTAQGARPQLEMYPRRLTYGMRTSTPGNGLNSDSVTGIEVARVLLNYVCRDGSAIDATGTCADTTLTQRLFDTGSGQMLLSKRLSSIATYVGGSDDTSLRQKRTDFHQYERGAGSSSGLCVTGVEAPCGNLVRRYTLGYAPTLATKRIRLESVQECGWDSTCLPVTGFSWADESGVNLIAGGRQSQVKNTPNGIDWNNLLQKGRIADVVGDGRSRIVKRVSANQLAVCTLSSAGTSFDCGTAWTVAVPAAKSIPDGGSTSTWHLADFTGDGIADLIVTENTNAFACASSTNGFPSCSALPDPYPTYDFGNGNRLQARQYARPADVDGDGRMDIVFYRGDGKFEICRYDGSWACQVPTQVINLSYSGAGTANAEEKNTLFSDFNGDGRADIAIRVNPACVNTPSQPGTLPGKQCPYVADTSSSYWVICFATGPSSNISFECSTRSGAGIGGAVPVVSGEVTKIATYDFNGDGLADMATAVMSGSTVVGWRVCVSVGDGEFANRATDGNCPTWTGPVGTVEKTVAGDFNGDGRTDLATWKPGQADNGTTWQICLSTGSGFSCSDVSGPTKPASCDNNNCAEAFVGDYDGNGKSEIAVNQHTSVDGSNGTLSFGLNTSTMPDLMKSVTTGLIATTSINYEPLSKPNGVYQKAATIGPSDPDPGIVQANEIVIQSPMYVVASTLASTGTGSYYKSSYNYQNLRADKWGRGLSGFYRRSVTDNVIADINGTVLDDTNTQVTGVIYNQAWPHIGRPLTTGKAVKASNGNFVTVSSSVMSYFSVSAANGVNRTDGASGQYTLWKSFQTRSIQNPNLTDFDLDGASKQPRVTTYTGIDPDTQAPNLAMFYDSFSNPLKVVTVTEHPDPATPEVWKQSVTNNYYNSGGDTTRWLLGKLQDATTITSVSGYTTNGATSVTRKSSFTYQGYGGSCTGAVNGQLCTETVEPDKATAGSYSLYQQSAYEYEPFGNRAKSTVSFYNDDAGTGGLQTRSSGTSYDKGKYPLISTRYYTGDSTRDLLDTREYTDVRCRMPTKVTDANGNFATTSYDGFCRKVSEAAYTKGSALTLPVKQTTFALDTINTLSNVNGIIAGQESYRLVTTSLDGGQSIAYYDNLQRAVRSRVKRFDNSTFAEATTTFDAFGRQYQSKKPAATGTSDGTATSTVITFDALNRPTQETLPDNNTVSTAYHGLTTTVTRSNNDGSTTTRSSSKTVNAKGMVATVSTAGVVTNTSYQYDAIGNLTQVQTPGANGSSVTKIMAYDIRGRQTSLSDLDAGNYTYAYSGVGEQILQTDGRGYTTKTDYDSFGRKALRTERQASGSVLATTTWSYDCINAKGLLCSVTYGGATTATTTKCTAYDQYSRPSVTTTTIDGKTFASSVAYDALGRPLYSVYPQATAQAAPLALQHFYSGAGYASEVKHATTGQSYWRVDARFADGQLQQAVLGGVLGLNPTYDSVSLGRISGMDVKLGVGGTSLLNQTFTFESVGNLKARTLVGAGRNESEAFTYDALDRLTQSSGSGIADTGSNGYDLAGNVTSKAGLPLTYTSTSNRLCAINGASCGAGTGNIAYDGNGNIQSYQRPDAGTPGAPGTDGALLNLYEYSSFNLPRLITKSLSGSVTASGEFFYDAGYQRVRQIKRSGAATTGTANIVDDVLYVVPDGFEVHRNSSGQVTSSIATISGADGVAATVSTSFDPNTGLPVVQNTGTNVSTAQSGTNTVTKLILKDHLGSMVGEITLAGTAASPSVSTATLVIHGFGPWGNARNGTTIASQLAEGQRGFTGHEHLAELGIIHMNGRLYDAVIGRFLQADPIIQAPHNAQSHNRYSYVMNNPLSFTDPSGFSAWTQWRGPIIGIVVSIITYGAASWAMGAYATLYGSTAFATAGIASTSLTGVGSATAAAAAGFAAGGISGGNIQSALQGAFTAVLMQGLLAGFDLPHGAPGTLGELAGKVAVHAAVGCVGGAMAGGSCGRGAASGGFAEFAGTFAGAGPMGQLGLQEGSPAHFAAQVAAGCAAGRLGGGSCSNGAFTAAFNYTTNILVAVINAGLRAVSWLATRQAGVVVAAEAGALIATGTPGGTSVVPVVATRVALGLGEDLLEFATKQGAITYKSAEFVVTGRFQSDFLRVMTDAERQILFNLDGIANPLASAQKGMYGFKIPDNVTNWELYQIKSNPEWWSRIQFFREGQPVKNPFGG